MSYYLNISEYIVIHVFNQNQKFTIYDMKSP